MFFARFCLPGQPGPGAPIKFVEFAHRNAVREPLRDGYCKITLQHKLDWQPYRDVGHTIGKTLMTTKTAHDRMDASAQDMFQVYNKKSSWLYHEIMV